MKKVVLFLLLSVFFISGYALSITDKMSENQRHFVKVFLPSFNAVNNQFIQAHHEIWQLYTAYENGEPISETQKKWLKSLAKQFQLKEDPITKKGFMRLIRRVDGIPPSLALAQAINESAWGRSRFARHGNNYFGRWCYECGCGIIPSRRDSGAQHEVKRYANLEASIYDYILMLNTQQAYSDFRRVRYHLREIGGSLSGMRLAKGLSRYSQDGIDYVARLQAIMETFGLSQLDIS